ncbi:26S proteasome regulatory complex, subunit RM1530/PSMD4 [Pseudoloma neurophilia]|uniref:26S proteasome regulatory complex, subunit RM1530/PSMD4 n=1 Tax=Pseudoloma neurophilia TaxID=146866 RepID=A0A0R0LVD6_9MICR|nr:26S proteasome regulatory complex, subunit RM1530/PSMD4 [Pseudoloma neurophilia]
MPETTIFIVDNSLYGQNQDYLPNRYMAQLNAINQVFSMSPEKHLFGAVPIGQPTPNYILTPTESRNDARAFLSNLGLSNNLSIASNVTITERIAKNVSEERKIVLFLSTVLNDIELQDTIVALQETHQQKTTVFVFLFGDAIQYYIFFDNELSNGNCRIFCVQRTENLTDIVTDALSGYMYDDEMDPQLALALKLSAQEAQQAQQNKK